MDKNEDQRASTAQTGQERFRIITKLESGGMADIYLGVQLGGPAFERLVVIKKIRSRGPQAKQAMGMFLDEARVIASLSHPHIVQIYDLSLVRNSVCITMEYIDGENLLFIVDWFKKEGRTMPLPIACRIIVQICEALQYAHNATSTEGNPLEIVHRDIDLRNLMLDRNGYAKIIDFGVAKAATQVELTAPTMIKGKLSYTAPETFSEPNVDCRADIYSLGLVFHQLITGKEPFPFKSDVNLGQVINTICNEELEPPSAVVSGLPPAIDAILEKATRKERKERYQTAEEFSAAILKFSEENPAHAIATSGEMKKWFQAEFEKRHNQRRKFEKKVLQKARILAEKESVGEYVDRSSIVPEPAKLGESPSQRVPHALPTVSLPPPPPPEAIARSKREQRDSWIAGITGQSQESESESTSSPPEPFRSSESMPELVAPKAVEEIPQDIGAQPAPPRRSLTRYLLGAAAAAVLAALAVAAIYLPSAEKPAPLPGEESAAESHNLVVFSRPDGADVFVDGVKAGVTQAQGLKLEVKKDEMHSLRIFKTGYDSYESAVWGKKTGIHRTEAVLVKTATPAAPPETKKEPAPTVAPLAPAAQAAPSKPVEAASPEPEKKPVHEPEALAKLTKKKPTAPKKAGPAPEPPVEQQKKADTPARAPAPQEPPPKPAADEDIGKPTWFSGTGEWSGAKVAALGCAKCHRTGINLLSRNAEEWQAFFKTGQHNRHAILSDYFSQKEIGRVLAYLLEKLKKKQEQEQNPQP